MNIAGRTALVSGANRGLGLALAAELLSRGAKVYAGARNPDDVDLPDAIPVHLDITSPPSVAAAADVAAEVTILINNAGISTASSLLGGELAKIRLEMETHYFGTLTMIRAFAPIIAANGGGAILKCSRGFRGTASPAMPDTARPSPPSGH
jgi:NAD(P)-dependent dehydrogenase (short-subunit alcohol dehydrogenase family)